MHILNTVELDMRLEDIDFRKILVAVQRLKREETLTIHTSFNPTPLYPIMKSKGFDFVSNAISENHWKVDFYRKEEQYTTKTLNLIGYEVNDIIFKTISALEAVKANHVLIIHLETIPEMILHYMNDASLRFHIEENSNGTYEITVKS